MARFHAMRLFPTPPFEWATTIMAIGTPLVKEFRIRNYSFLQKNQLFLLQFKYLFLILLMICWYLPTRQRRTYNFYMDGHASRLALLHPSWKKVALSALPRRRSFNGAFAPSDRFAGETTSPRAENHAVFCIVASPANLSPTIAPIHLSLCRAYSVQRRTTCLR